MLFTSYEFIGFFAVCLLLYYILPRRLQWPLLLTASCLFYFAAGREYLIFIAVTTLSTYAAARLIGANLESQTEYLRVHKAELGREEKKSYRESQRRIRYRAAALCVVLNLGILAMVKYTNFAISNINAFWKLAGGTGELSFVNMILPLGISFYTFRAVGYLIDVYRGTVQAEKNIFRFALYISFFPLIIQGPITSYGELTKSLYSQHAFDANGVARGLERMLWGYFKKLVIADRLLTGVSTIIGDTASYNGAYIFAVMLFYSVELYADFSGGIDITIGIAQTFGIEVEENFNRPYFSKSLKEYWRRWHISMSVWFRTYLFYPISISKPMQKLLKFSKKHFGARVGKRLPVYLSSFIVWFATGIWHGASWNFIAWGLANWLILMISEELEPLYLRFHGRFGAADSLPYRLFQVGRTFLLVSVLKLFDCYETVGETFGMLISMFTVKNWRVLWDGSLMNIGLTATDYWVLGAGTLIMLGVSLCQRKGSVRDQVGARPYPVRFMVWFGLFVAVLLMGAYGIGYDASQFIYNRF